MNKFARSDNGGRTVVAALLSAVFVCVLALSVSPQFHQRVHGDANRAEHICAVTLIASGSYEHAAHPPLIGSPAPAVLFSRILAFAPPWVESPFLNASVFEHAPPAHS